MADNTQEIEVNVITLEQAMAEGRNPQSLIDVATWSYDQADAEYNKKKGDKTKNIPRAKRLKAQAKQLREVASQLKNAYKDAVEEKQEELIHEPV